MQIIKKAAVDIICVKTLGFGAKKILCAHPLNHLLGVRAGESIEIRFLFGF